MSYIFKGQTEAHILTNYLLSDKFKNAINTDLGDKYAQKLLQIKYDEEIQNNLISGIDLTITYLHELTFYIFKYETFLNKSLDTKGSEIFIKEMYSLIKKYYIEKNIQYDTYVLIMMCLKAAVSDVTITKEWAKMTKQVHSDKNIEDVELLDFKKFVSKEYASNKTFDVVLRIWIFSEHLFPLFENKPAEAEEINKLYGRILNAPITNQLAATRTDDKRKSDVDEISGSLSIIEPDYKLFITKFEELKGGLRITAKVLIDILMMELTESGYKDSFISMPLDKYMELRNLKDEKSTRKQIKDDFEAIQNLYMESHDTAIDDWIKCHISGGTYGIKNKMIFFRFNEDFYKYMKSVGRKDRTPAIMPLEAFSFNLRANPHSYYLLRRASLEKYMNRNKDRANIIRVKSLLDACPSLPKYDDVMNSGKHISQQIIEPFIRDMDNINSFSWQFCEKNGEPVEDPTANYKDFESCLILLDWKEYPELEAANIQQ